MKKSRSFVKFRSSVFGVVSLFFLALAGNSGGRLSAADPAAAFLLKVVKDTAPRAGFGAQAVRHLKTRRFIPAFINGRPAEIRASKEYVFILKR